MNRGENFENNCYNYLKEYYHLKNSKFEHKGGMNSTESDIAVVKNGEVDFYIEVKDSQAQSGQFVVLPDEESKTFIYSPRNHTEPNEMTDAIISYMNTDFERFNNAGTAGEKLDLDSSIFSNWIIEHYRSRNVKYIMSQKDNFVILPIRKFAIYFDVVANYRAKKSGSRTPAEKDIPIIMDLIKNTYLSAQFHLEGKKLFVTIYETIFQNRFIFEDYTFWLSPKSNNRYEIRKLSNTNNKTVIFSVELREEQNINDLLEFESDL